MEWSIQQIAREAGTTSRTLRHYGQIGLLAPARVGRNGYRYYDQTNLVRLQRILLLRDLGLNLDAIARILDAGTPDTREALHGHLRWLEQERDRIDRQIASVRTTLRKTERGEALMPAEVFDGFDHTRYKDEVIARWGEDAYRSGDRWWQGLSETEKQQFQQAQRDIGRDYAAAHAAGRPADAADVQAVTARHVRWLGTATQQTPSRTYLVGLGDMYVADPRFAANYGEPGDGTVEFVRDAMRVYAERHLTD
ncbi:MerR family transcriptional regulator [Pilimelia terevasa]|uniref:MerR family transcriptional regulator n=1 Tax=Pilimelia terevasa TaxID=53372 RepID=A0A8J3BSU1_9ACTN|nr:MerR family transcriptional regulator [Pilimelia terevasa]GGK37412.1 MerR family transcriptional regulator [Pilimelia terevasa]